MTNNLQVFTNSEFGSIRTVEIDGQIYFVGKDVANLLGYKDTDKAIRDHVDAEDKKSYPAEMAGQVRHLIFINESGLYSLILSSHLPKAKEFKRWITNEVIPSIRKTGAYFTNDIAQDILNDPLKLVDIFKNFAIEREKRLLAEEKLKAQAPKVLFADAVETSDKDILVGELAKLISQNGVQIGQNRLFKWLRDNGYLIKAGRADYNMPTQKYLDMGLFRIKETSIIGSNGETHLTRTPKITGKGQVYFVNKFMNPNKV